MRNPNLSPIASSPHLTEICYRLTCSNKYRSTADQDHLDLQIWWREGLGSFARKLLKKQSRLSTAIDKRRIRFGKYLVKFTYHAGEHHMRYIENRSHDWRIRQLHL